MVQAVRIQKDLEALNEFTATPGQGTTRLSYSAEAAKARPFIKEIMVKAGLTVREDALGNIFGRLSTPEIDHKPIVLVGSHYDSVPNGGMFDGPAGIMAGLEVARLFQDQGLVPQYPLEIVAMVEEEGTSFNSGLLASRALCGFLTYEDLQKLQDQNGLSAAEHITNAGYHPEEVEKLAYPPKALKAFLELHIEQGPILENLKKDVGIVDVIVGISQLQVVIQGKAGHAGTTPMGMRSDALLSASRVIATAEKIAIEAGEYCVATVGRLNVYPNGSNVIPDKVTFTVDIRSKFKDKLDAMIAAVKASVHAEANSGITVSEHLTLYVEPTELSTVIVNNFREQSNRLGILEEPMVSGAGHDAMIFAKVTDVGLIFVPSKDGISHHPAEWTDYDEIAKGVEVLFETVKVLTEAKGKSND